MTKWITDQRLIETMVALGGPPVGSQIKLQNPHLIGLSGHCCDEVLTVVPKRPPSNTPSVDKPYINAAFPGEAAGVYVFIECIAAWRCP